MSYKCSSFIYSFLFSTILSNVLKFLFFIKYSWSSVVAFHSLYIALMRITNCQSSSVIQFLWKCFFLLNFLVFFDMCFTLASAITFAKISQLLSRFKSKDLSSFSYTSDLDSALLKLYINLRFIFFTSMY